MADRFQTLSGGKKVLTEATVVSTGAGEAGDIPALDATGKLDPSLMPPGVVADVQVAEASETLSAGDYVNIYDDGGTNKVRLADNSNGREAHGFVKAGFAIAAQATVYFEGPNPNVAADTAPTRVYLGTLGGIITTPLDITANPGKIHQFLGVYVAPQIVNTDASYYRLR